MGHNALHYSKAKGKSHVRRILQSVNQPDEQDDLSNCIAYGEGNLNLPEIKDRNSTPRKRKAPPPPNKAKPCMYPEMAQDNKEKKREKDCSQTKPQRKKKNSPALQEQTIHIPQEQKTPIAHGNCISKTQEPVDPDSQEQINPELEKQVTLDLEESISQKTLVAFIPDLQEEDMSHRMEPFVSNPEEKNTPDSQEQNDSTMYNPCIPSFQEHNVIDISNTEQGHQQLLLLQDVMQQAADNAEMEYDLDILEPPADSSGAERKFDVMLPASDYSGTEHELFIQSTNHITGVTEKELEELQKEVQFLKEENKELQERIKILEDYERDGGDMDSSADFVPVVLFDSLQREYDRVQEQLREAHNSLQSLQNSTESFTYPSCKLAPTETVEQLDEVQTNYTPTLLETNYTQKFQHNESQKNEDKEMSENIISLQESTKQWEEAEKELRRLRENEEKYKVIEEEWKEMQVIKQQNTEMEEELKRLKKNEKKYMEMIEALEKSKGGEKLGICIEELGNMQEKEEIGIEKQDKASVLQKNDGQSTVKLKGEIKAIQEQMHIVTFNMQNAGQNMSDGWVQVREKDIEQLKTVTDKYQVLIKEIMDQLQLIQRESDEAQKQLREAHASLLSKDKHIKELQDNQKEAEAAINSEAILKSQLETDYKRAEAELVKLRDYQNEVQDLYKLIDNLRKEAQDLKDQLECAQLSDKCLTSQQYDQRCLNQVEEQLAQTQERLMKALQELQIMQQNTVTIQEHHQMQESLSCEVQDLKIKVRQLDQKLKSREKEIELLQRELDAVQIKDQTNEALKNEVNSLTKKLSELSKQHERTSTEVFQVQREALFMKSEKQAAEEQLEKVQCEKERIQGQLLQLQKEKCHNVEQSVETDKKISELSQEIISLKEALQRNTLKATEKIIDDNQKEGQQQQKLLKEMECLQLKIKTMKQNQIEEERHHGSVIAIYRDYLLRAVQGQINEDAMRIINQILQMHLRR
ncbi:ankyrin repeat domain-containing protein 24 [Spea bombifrons]|uniref:ankyrin repeat domain-containing protein 24 n=1 Tax=Spea bombifrons TaxID=233779 RepID=UPI00234AF110|nr:ankyrin repeat domain-containing protein 24 [Spea bombifrons]